MLDFLSGSALFILTCSIILLLVNRSKLRQPFRVILGYLCLGIVIEIAAITLKKSGENNLFLLHIYTLLEFILISVYYLYVNKGKFTTKFTIYLIIGSVLFCANTYWLQPLDTFNSYSKSMVQIILIYLSVSHLIRIIRRRINNRPSETIISSAVLLYNAGSLFIFMTSNIAMRLMSEGLHSGFWIFNAILNLLFQLMILLAIWKELKATKYTYT